ncbi:MAG: trypsin-like peptidase domain-containing protein [Armatimonadota bacterium]|nr:trypsin-like peptidase domain-containing protein [Armatimonadota bacterium]MDR7400831.1 trypsin-like peptidase domain-containing protein [Armatimonadota bacterium]MDR7404263.1 trypsin-like peptidase domain-containing protein [Armatimonadota bacterium]MDR7436576.1 trypsin-like peptidase domain-containing protein [Armatimonadota bacterium]MDR7473112.1 trypsin-like peptidase domain-containing protein [Armatimonadota bacterium]
MPRRPGAGALAAALAWLGILSVGRAAPAQEDRWRALLARVAVRVDVELAEMRGVCTGWVGWSEPSRSAVYTAAHCFRPDARYRLHVSTGQAVYATAMARWEDLDVMALWVPRGQLPALRAWKPLPSGAFRVLYLLRDRDADVRVADAGIPRVLWEIRFHNHPSAVALPLFSAPGTSGSPVVDAADGLLIGMVVGFLADRQDIAAVVPAQQIHAALLAGR